MYLRYHLFAAVPINSDLEMRDVHEVGNEPQNMSLEENPGFESMGDEIDGGLPLVEADLGQPVETAAAVSYLKTVCMNSPLLTHCCRETSKNVIGKQCRPRSDAAECDI